MPWQVLFGFSYDKYVEKPTALKAFEFRVCELAEIHCTFHESAPIIRREVL